MVIVIESMEQLSAELKKAPPASLKASSFTKSRCVSPQQYRELQSLELNFEPYTTVAKNCGMSSCAVLRSVITNRFYVGYVNMGGHGARFEVMPVRHAQVLSASYLESLYRDHGQQINRRISRAESYEL